MATDPIIRVEDLTAGYNDNVLMQDVTFTVNRGRFSSSLAAQVLARAPC
jgi:ABC-type cobalamin/Fe3+-siderophores transport system ATPase subunit